MEPMGAKRTTDRRFAYTSLTLASAALCNTRYVRILIVLALVACERSEVAREAAIVTRRPREDIAPASRSARTTR